ncbi:MAG: TIM-barrel domain-containing protein [Sphingobacteriaceae bacterium]
MKVHVFLAFFILGLMGASAQQKPNTYTYSKQIFSLQTAQGSLSIRPYSATIFRVVYGPAKATTDTTAVLVGNAKTVKINIKEKANSIILTSDSLQLRVDKQSLAIAILNKKTQEVYTKGTANAQQLQFSLAPQEALYGTGSRAISQNRRGFMLQNYHQPHYGYSLGEQNLNVSIPFIISSKGYGIYFDNIAAGTFDLGRTKTDELRYLTESGRASYFIMTGSNDQLLASYTYLTGKQPLPPRWALGFIQSRFGYKSATETIETVKKTIAAGYPIDATVLDLYWYGDVKTMGNHAWRRDSFPEPEKMLHTLKDLGVKTILITQTFVTKLSDNFATARSGNLLAKNAKGEDYIIEDFWAGAAGLVDIFKPKAQQYLWNFYRQRINEGVAGWWCDLGEPEKHPDEVVHSIGKARDVHSIYPLTWAKTIYEGYQKDFPEQRVFNLARSGGAGMQRYATFPWSGDVFRSWNGYKAQIPIMLGMSMSGIGYMHADAGGFAQGEKDAELYIRWMEFAAFTPIYRAHADPAVAAPEPVFWDEATQKIVKDYVNMRYRFLPYTYSLAYQNTTTGRPLAMPINYFEPNNTHLSAVNDEYLWGKDLLIAPIQEKGKTSRTVYLPKGRWINWWTSEVASDSAVVFAPLEQLPIFAKSGSIIPMTTTLKNTEDYTGNTLVLRYFADATQQAEFTLYDDNGKDPQALAKKQYELISFKGKPRKHSQKVEISGGKKGKLRSIRIELIQPGKASTFIELSYMGGEKSVVFKL